ncbi:unnamed protein product [Brassicogethes aeneus]|uniref:CIDE-N domain-containing protein n=1 Tax=Brassicogethes aeneus TaxID=1431903 RepID=A0A9P0FKJ6_BRAAE|nr:unnamed protein product [Brassicogethes aeneus]
MERMAYKIWNQDRSKKICLILKKEIENLYETIILEASKKLNIDGNVICLEKDGTVLQEKEEIEYFSNEIFILLTKNENWMPELEQMQIITVPNNSDTDNSTITFSSEKSTEESLDTQNYNILWDKFLIPWQRLPKTVLEKLENSTRKSSITSRVVNMIVDELREIKTTIPIKVFKEIAKQIVDKYPNSFQDVDEDGNIFGNGIGSLVTKFIDRNNYLNRPHKKQIDINVPKLKGRKLLAARAGCSNWEGEMDSEKENYSDESDFVDLKDSTKLIEETKQEQTEYLALTVVAKYFKECIDNILYRFKENITDTEINQQILINECCVVEKEGKARSVGYSLLQGHKPISQLHGITHLKLIRELRSDHPVKQH